MYTDLMSICLRSMSSSVAARGITSHVTTRKFVLSDIRDHTEPTHTVPPINSSPGEDKRSPLRPVGAISSTRLRGPGPHRGTSSAIVHRLLHALDRANPTQPCVLTASAFVWTASYSRERVHDRLERGERHHVHRDRPTLHCQHSTTQRSSEAGSPNQRRREPRARTRSHPSLRKECTIVLHVVRYGLTSCISGAVPALPARCSLRVPALGRSGAASPRRQGCRRRARVRAGASIWLLGGGGAGTRMASLPCTRVFTTSSGKVATQPAKGTSQYLTPVDIKALTDTRDSPCEEERREGERSVRAGGEVTARRLVPAKARR